MIPAVFVKVHEVVGKVKTISLSSCGVFKRQRACHARPDEKKTCAYGLVRYDLTAIRAGDGLIVTLFARDQFHA